jgi:hypothetical protein
MARVTHRRIKRVIATARRNFGVDLTPEIARGIIAWDDEGSFVAELEDSGELDTAPLDYFSMALLEQLMPGKPTVQDGLISAPLERWHFPLNGSSSDYCDAFAKAWRKAVRRLRAGR